MTSIAPSLRTTSFTVGTASTGPFSVGFRLFSTDTLSVHVNGSARSDWTLTADVTDGFDDAATITFSTTIAAGSTVLIDGAWSVARDADLLPSQPDFVTVLNEQISLVTIGLQEAKRDIARSVRSLEPLDPVSGLDTGDLFTIPFGAIFATRAAFVTWNSTASVGQKTTATAGGLAYRYSGSTAISDLSGWEPMFSVTPEHFGAKNNGSAAAQAAINAAITYVGGQGGGTVLCTGTYLLTDSILLQTGVALIGQNRPVLRRGGLGFDMIDQNDGADGPISYSTVRGFDIDGQKGTYANGDSITIRGTYNKVLDCYIYDAANRGIALLGGVPFTYAASGTTTITCTLNKARTITNGSTQHLQFKGSIPDDDYVVTVISSTVFTVTAATAYTETGSGGLKVCDTNDNLIEGNRVARANTIGIDVHTSPRNTIRYNQVQSAGGEGIAVDNESSRCLVDGNFLLGNGGSGGIGSGNSDYSRFVNNLIDQSSGPSGRACISIGNAAGAGNNYVIANNTLIGSTVAAVWLRHDPAALPGEGGYYTSAYCTISGNNVIGCAATAQIDVGCNNNVVRGNSGNNAAARTIINNGTGNDVDQRMFGPTGAPVTYTTSVTLAVSDLDPSNRIAVRYNASGAATLTLPTGSALDAYFTEVSIGDATDLVSVVCTSTGAATIAGNTGVTLLGNAVVAGNASSLWRLRKTATATWIAYRLS